MFNLPGSVGSFSLIFYGAVPAEIGPEGPFPAGAAPQEKLSQDLPTPAVEGMTTTAAVTGVTAPAAATTGEAVAAPAAAAAETPACRGKAAEAAVAAAV